MLHISPFKNWMTQMSPLLAGKELTSSIAAEQLAELVGFVRSCAREARTQAFVYFVAIQDEFIDGRTRVEGRPCIRFDLKLNTLIPRSRFPKPPMIT